MRYLRSNYGIKKIGAHGESLGGLAACHLAKHAELDFVCAGRTFTSLTDVVHYMLGKCLGGIFHWITFWTDENTRNFVDAHCYKIITFDPKDEIIPYEASLRYGISHAVLSRLEGLDEPNDGVLSKLKAKVKKTRLLNKDQQGSSRLLTSNQTHALYNALKRLMLVLNELSKVENIEYKGNQNISNASIFIDKKKKTQPENRGSLNTSASFMSEDGEGSEEGEENSPIFSRKNNRLIEAISPEELKLKETNVKEITKKEIASFISLISDEDKQSPQFQNFIFEVILTYCFAGSPIY